MKPADRAPKEKADRKPLVYGKVWLESGSKFENGEFTYRNGYRKYCWDATDSCYNGQIMERGYWLDAEICMGIVRELSNTNRIPKTVQSRIYKALCKKLPGVRFRVTQNEIFINILKEYAPWIDSTKALALTQAK